MEMDMFYVNQILGNKYKLMVNIPSIILIVCLLSGLDYWGSTVNVCSSVLRIAVHKYMPTFSENWGGSMTGGWGGSATNFLLILGGSIS